MLRPYFVSNACSFPWNWADTRRCSVTTRRVAGGGGVYGNCAGLCSLLFTGTTKSRKAFALQISFMTKLAGNFVRERVDGGALHSHSQPAGRTNTLQSWVTTPLSTSCRNNNRSSSNRRVTGLFGVVGGAGDELVHVVVLKLNRTLDSSSMVVSWCAI